MKWIETKQTKGVLSVTLNRPETRNAFNSEMIQEITKVFSEVPTEIRVILLRGTGKVFSAGADLEWMKSMINYTKEENKTDSLELYQMFHTIKNCSTPIITIVQGAVYGGGLGLLSCSDIVLAEESTQFCFSEVRLGLAPAVISNFILQKCNQGTVGPWMISGRVFGVQEALSMGLIHQKGNFNELEDASIAWIQSFLEAAPQAVRETKKLLNRIAFQSEDERKTETIDLIANRRVSSEGQEGLKSFLTKQNPSWKVTEL